jgi:hypothetical protein
MSAASADTLAVLDGIPAEQADRGSCGSTRSRVKASSVHQTATIGSWIVGDRSRSRFVDL